MMHDRDNENLNINRRQDDNDEGWVYPDRLPGQNGSAYGYDVKRRAKRPVNPNAMRQPRQPVNAAPGSMARRGAVPQGAVQQRPPQRQMQGAPVQRGAQNRAPQGNAAGPQRVYTDPRYPARPQTRRPAGNTAPNGGRPGQPVRQQSRGQYRPAQRQGEVRRQQEIKPQSRWQELLAEITPKKIAIAAAVVLAIILLFILIPKLKSKGSAAEPTVVTETPPVTEPVTEQIPEPEPPKYPYSERTADTKEFADDEISCRNAILIDVDTHTVIAEKGGDDRIFPASMTKVMTVLTAASKCSDLNEKFTMTEEIVAPLLSQNATSAGFEPGEEITVKDLIYGALLPSGADGTGGLAAYTSGSEEEFAKAMNEKAAELGLKGTHFSNASGLHAEDHYSTCQEIAIIFEAAMDDPDIAAALGAWEYVTSSTSQHPEGIHLIHTLLGERLEGSEEFDEKIEVIGGKTGYTDEAGNCLVTMARVASTGKRYIFVCAGGDGKWAPVYDTIHVYRNYLGEQFDGEYVPKYMR